MLKRNNEDIINKNIKELLKIFFKTIVSSIQKCNVSIVYLIICLFLIIELIFFFSSLQQTYLKT